MGNEAVLKVFHAARQDIEIVWHQSGTIPHPIFDTQVAAMVLGYGDSIAYDQLVERVTGHRPDKTHRFTDWSRRPLTPRADALRGLRRHPFARRVRRARRRPEEARPQRLGQRGNGSPDLAENLSISTPSAPGSG